MPKLMTAARCRWPKAWWCAPKPPQVRAGAQVHAGIPADQSSARLPGVRQGRRVRTAGHGVPLRRGREPLHRREAPRADEKQWSPVVFFDAPRCILCFRCVRICNEGMGVGALGVINRGVVSRDRSESRRSPGVRRVRRLHRHLPGRRADQRHLSLQDAAVGDGRTSAPSARTARTAARRRWACATTRSSAATTATSRASTASSCASRAATRSISTIIRSVCNRRWCGSTASWKTVSWSRGAGGGREEVQRDRRRAAASSASSVRTTRPTKRTSTCRSSRAQVLDTNNIDHHRTGDVVTLLDALSGKTERAGDDGRSVQREGGAGGRRRSGAAASAARVPDSRELPASSGARLRGHAGPVREDKYAVASVRVEPGGELDGVESLRDKLKAEPELVILFGDADQGRRRPQAGGFRRFARHSGEVRLPGRLFEFARRDRYGAAPDCCRATGQRHAGLTSTRCSRRRSGCALGGRRESAEGRRWPREGGLRGGAGHVPDRDGAAGRRRAAGGVGLREERHGHQRLRRSAAAEARHQDHGRQAGPRNHGLHRAGNGRRSGARSLDAATRCSKRSARRCTGTMFRCR